MRHSSRFRRRLVIVAVVVAAAAAALRPQAQVAENAADPFGIAIPYPLVHLEHSTDPAKPGTTADLRARDPFLLYALGRDLLNRQYERRHGVGGRPGELSVPLYAPVARALAFADGHPARHARDHAASCGLCHSSVYREPSAGQTIASTSGLGRNTTHFFGGGLVEMIGEQVTRAILDEFDIDGNGIIERTEAVVAGAARVQPAPTAAEIDFGTPAPDAHGVPQLNSVFRLWYVDRFGRVLPDATSLHDPDVEGFGLAMQPFGWGRGRVSVGGRMVAQGGDATTLREFFTVAADVHMGLQAHDPTQDGGDRAARGFGGVARVSLNGAQQYDFGGAIDRGERLTPGGVSLDDPDGDGYRSELTEGDIDAIEFFLLHTPAPAATAGPAAERGAALLARTGCTQCHVESWQLKSAAAGVAGDRRLFRLDATVAADGSVSGRLVRHAPAGTATRGRHRAGGPFAVERIYSDFKHWDIGPEFHERRFDGTVQTEHRTAPLWGVGSTAPYGHAGNFRDLRSVILAHGGAASASRHAFRALSESDRTRLVEYLQSLVLYSTTEIPSDIDGDGRSSPDFHVDGQPVGYERFNPEFLFSTPPRYRRVGDFVHPNGHTLPRLLIANIDETFGLLLAHRRDGDRNGFPDRLGPLGPAN